MFTSLQHGRRYPLPCLVGLLFMILTVAGGAASAQTTTDPVVIRVEDNSATIQEDGTVSVTVVVENAMGVAGIDFAIEYPADLLAVDAPTTHTNEGLWDLLVVNHEGDSGDPSVGRINVAAADAVGREVASGTLMTIDFPVTCLGFAQDWPEGRPITLSVVDPHATVEDTGGSLINDAPVDGVDGTLTVDCTTVGIDSGASFGTLKAVYGGGVVN